MLNWAMCLHKWLYVWFIKRGFQKFCGFGLLNVKMFQGPWVAGCLGIVAQCNWPMRYDSNNSDTAQSLSDAKIANFRTQQELNYV